MGKGGAVNIGVVEKRVGGKSQEKQLSLSKLNINKSKTIPPKLFKI